MFCLQTLNRRLPLEDGSDRLETLGKRVSDDSRHFIFRRRRQKKKIFCRTLNGRLPLEHGSDRRETLGKCVSDDSRHFIFRFPNFVLGDDVQKIVFWRS